VAKPVEMVVVGDDVGVGESKVVKLVGEVSQGLCSCKRF
jgi:hypothetical protein